MSLSAHIHTLQSRKDALDIKLDEAYTHHSPDSDISLLKKQKLYLKDQLTQLERMRNNAA